MGEKTRSGSNPPSQEAYDPRTAMPVRPRDFLKVEDHLYFAVLSGREDAGRFLTQLRYRKEGHRWIKMDTRAASDWIKSQAPHYCFYSEEKDIALHGVPIDQIQEHFCPQKKLADLLINPPRGILHQQIKDWVRALSLHGVSKDQLGITGSVLIGAEGPGSDLDFVVYDQPSFHAARRAVEVLLSSGVFDPLDDEAWELAYAKRGCDLDFKSYRFHEQRKFNKGLIQGTKFDLTLLTDHKEPPLPSRKMGQIRLIARVVDSEAAFAYPGIYRIEHPEIQDIHCYTQTYCGQAEQGEWIEVSGVVEQTADGEKRLIVGTSREAPGEYIRVITP